MSSIADSAAVEAGEPPAGRGAAPVSESGVPAATRLIHVICGPTAAGKSALALRLAERHPITIISADSRQVYRGFDIGTAKPSPLELERVPHRGIDVADPVERYTAARWAREAAGWIAEAERAGRAPLIVGGTGFYLRALLEPLFAEPALDPARRAALQHELSRLDTPALRAWIERLDPPRAHLGRTQLLRAAEVALLAGRRISDLQRAAQRRVVFAARILVVDPGPALRARLESRLDAMVRAGWEDEVRALARSVPPDAPAWNATGYRSLRALTAGELPRHEALQRVLIDTRQYAKRQRTWFRHQLGEPDVTRLDPEAAGADAAVARWWSARTDEEGA